MSQPRVIIIGGGFGGLNAAKSLKNAPVDVLVIDKTNHHLFQPLLYQVASAALSPADISAPIRKVLRKQKNTTVIMGEVSSIDLTKKTVTLADDAVFPYDYLILAPGANHSYFGHDAWENYAPGLKTLVDALRIREKVLMALEHAERCDSPQERQKFLRFVVIGGGPTGVEMAGAIAEIAHQTMFENFRNIKPENSEVYLIEGAAQILPSYPPHLGNHAQRDLEKMGVKVLLNTFVTDINQDGVVAGNSLIETANVIWAAGNQASPLLKTLSVPLDKQGRVFVDPDLSIPSYPNAFVIGDAAHILDKTGQPLPGVAPVAMQGGHYVAALIRKAIPKEQRRPFRYLDKGTMATIGKHKAVAQMGRWEFTGLLAWLAWGVIHIMFLITFSNRILVMMRWFFWYLTGTRTVWLITRPDSLKK